MSKTIFAAALSIALASCSSSGDAVDILTKQGYTEIETHGYSFFSCSEDDTFATAFTAKGPSGQRVSGTVCSGWLKGKTVRLD